MSEFPNADIDTLRQSRIARLEAELHELASRLTHLHWPSTEAEVTECHPARLRRGLYGNRFSPPPLQLDYIVSFSYVVDGKKYTGVLNSTVEVEPGDRFQLRYNPEHPSENNSVCSDNSPATIYATVANVAVAGLMIFFLLAALKDPVLRFFKH